MTNSLKGVLIGVILPLQIISAVLAWRDLAQRTDEEVRGNKRGWRVFVSMNPGDAMVYRLFGRR